jgi:hypothetical protein
MPLPVAAAAAGKAKKPARSRKAAEVPDLDDAPIKAINSRAPKADVKAKPAAAKRAPAKASAAAAAGKENAAAAPKSRGRVAKARVVLDSDERCVQF